MGAYRAFVRSLCAYDYVSAVPALPNLYFRPLEYLGGLNVFEQLSVAFLVGLFYRRNASELRRKLREAFLVCSLCKAVVHVGPLVVLAVRCCRKVLGGIAYALEFLKPELGMLLFVRRGLCEDVGDLLEAFLLCLGREIGVLVPCLGFPSECCPEVLLCLCSCVFICQSFHPPFP